MATETLDQDLVAGVIETVTAAAHAVLAEYSTAKRPSGIADIGAWIGHNDAISMSILRLGLQALRPDAQLIEDEAGTGLLPDGEWWVVDPVEGAINLIHGMPDWCVTATLIRDNVSILTVAHLPLTNETYLACRGGGAFLNGHPMTISCKPDLHAAMVGTGQAIPGESADMHRRIGGSVTAMLGHALTVRVSVPATFQLIQVAAGRMDAFWQFSQVRSGIVCGALLVSEAGGQVIDLDGKPWTLDSPDFLAAPPQFATPIAGLLRPLR